MNAIKITFTVLIGLISTTAIAGANYYAQDYDPSYLPYNFQEAVDADYSGCNEVLEEYDTGYWQLDEKFEALQKGIDYDGPVWVPMGSESAFNLNQLRDFAEEEIRSCIVDYRDYLDEQEAEAEEQAKKDAEEAEIAQRLSDIEKALEDCDLDFFDDMTNSEKMDTFDEREACKNQPEEVVEETPVAEPTTPTYVPPTPVGQEVKQTYTPPEPTTYSEPETEEKEEHISTTTQATTTETITVTPEELEAMVQERVEEVVVQEEPKTEEKPTVFKRVVNFLFGWLW